MPCSHGYRSPQEYYDAAIIDKCIVVFGRTSEEILKALTFYDKMQPWSGNTVKQEQSKMTREEAYKVARKWLTEADSVVDCLEALGLLKFDEVETQLWRCGQGETRAFAKGIDPNHSSGYVWTKVYSQQQPETITIYVGSHSHDVSILTIEEALKAKGYRIERN
jgi:hypothetical protein